MDKEDIRRLLAASRAPGELAEPGAAEHRAVEPGAAEPGAAEQSAPAPGSSAAALVPAAVLIALINSPQGLEIILTQRTAEMRNHPAQVSLPGGRIEPQDASPADAALREAAEEVGLPPDRVEILGCLPLYRTVSDYCVHPFVGWAEPPVSLVPDEREVADVFLVPLQFVIDPRNHKRETMWRDGREHHYYVLPYPGRRIWGATAAILVSLARVLGYGDRGSSGH
jgi:8-oxo-dGTP pyrophosphatase MutT (NUDIX family)